MCQYIFTNSGVNNTQKMTIGHSTSDVARAGVGNVFLLPKKKTTSLDYKKGLFLFKHFF